MTVTAVFLTATATTDEYNNATLDWDAPAESIVEGCEHEPTATREDRDGGESVRTAGKLYTPPGQTVVHTQRVRIGTDTYSIDGKPRDWGSGLEIDLVEIQGTES